MDAMNENDICLTGIAGYFPECDSVKELGEKLFNKVDLINDEERRWKHTNAQIPRNMGKIKEVCRFDASFFGLPYKIAHVLEPMTRLALERVYECLIDAGVNPSELRNTNTAVIVGSSSGESEKIWLNEKVHLNQYGVTACTRSSMPTHISDWFKLNGPSYTIDTACSSSLFAVEHGYKLIRDGICDAAIVVGTNLILHPWTTVCFVRLGVLSVDGRCKSFDERANGYGRSESIATCYLQKAKDSRRVHARLVHAQTNCDGYKEQGISYPAGQMQQQLLSKFYQECGIPPSSLEFVEAHGTGTRAGDPEELSAIDAVFSPGRTEPLLIGSIKSNLAHSEPCSGLNSIAKLCIAYNTGYIPPNINFKIPRQKVPALTQGRLKVVTEKQPWNRGLSSVSSFGFGGANAHILLQNTARNKVNNGLPSDSLPRLVCVSGRTESAVAKILDDLESRPVDVDEVRLWHAIHEHGIKGHHFRGFVLLGSTPNKSVRLVRDIQHYSSDNALRPACFVYTSFELRWPAIALQLMEIPIFADALQRCHAVLETKQINLMSLFNTDDQVHVWQKDYALIGNVAVHIGLTDILKAVGITPNEIISLDHHELCNAYADGSLSAEETILAAYNISMAFKDSQAPMDVAQAKWQDSTTKQRAAEYLTNCLKKDVKPTSTVSPNAIVIHIGTDGPTFDKLVPKNVTVVRLAVENMEDVQSVLAALGILFEVGHNPLLANLYPKVEFPVSQSTPLLSHLVGWDHKDTWFTGCTTFALSSDCYARTLLMTLKTEDNDYIAGHTIDGRIIYPATGYLVLVWETFAALLKRHYTEVSVVFTEIYFQRATNIPNDGSVLFTITLQRGTGCFEVQENGMSIVTGYIKEHKKVGDSFRAIPNAGNSSSDPGQKLLSTKDFYKELNLRGYQYKGQFRGVQDSDVEGTRGSLIWNTNWVTFLDTMLQVNMVANDARSLYVPTRIEKFSIDVDLHYKVVSQTTSKFPTTDNSTLLEFKAYPNVGITRAGGAEIRGVHVTAISKRPPLGIPVYERNCFIPNYSKHNMMLKDAVRIIIQLILENIQAYKFKSIELVDTEYTANELQPIIEEVGDVLADLPLVRAELLVLSENSVKLPSNITVANKKIGFQSNAVLLIGANLCDRPNVLSESLNALKKNGFLLCREGTSNPNVNSKELEIIAVQQVESEYLILLRRKIENSSAAYIEICTQDYAYRWIDEVKKNIDNGQTVVLYNQNELHNGLLGLVNCLRKEPGGEKVYGVLIADSTAPKFDPSLKFYKDQLDKKFAINVFKEGQWGTYRHLLLEEPEPCPTNHAYLKPTVIGDMSSLRWLEGPYSEYSSDELVHVYCSALNFRDVMTTTGRVTVEAVARGRLDQECVQGLEVSGKTLNGTRVMAFCQRGISNVILLEKSALWPVPDEWSLAEAVTVPVAYATAYMSLVMVGQMRKGESVLIHAGSGAVGQAAINIALHHGLEVFTTVGSPAKRAFIKILFPQIKDNHIGNSRDTTFEDMIRRETNGRGVDLVLNSLADDKLQASVKCLGQRGRFLEIGKYDVTINTQLETCFLKKEISFHGVMLDYIHNEGICHLKKLSELVVNGIESGAVRPISYCKFEKEEIESAFRYMAAGKHIGKVIIKIRDDDSAGRPVPMPINAIPRYICNADCVYVLVGGLGGFGLELADWLVLRGARKLLFSSRRGVSNGYQALRIRMWKSYGTKIEISTDDVTTETGCQSMLKAAGAMGPVRAIFNLAVILKDAIFQNQTPEMFRESFRPKAQATMNLDKYSQLLCPELRDFVIFSSVSCGRGNAGQTNYGFSNSVMERVCEDRKRKGLPALAIQWGAIGDVGLVADMQEEDIQLEIGGTLQQRISSCLQAMDKFMKQDAPIVSSIVVAEKRSADYTSGNIIKVIARIIGIGDLKTISRQVPLSEMGMDSVMAVEIKQTLERDYEIFLSAQEIRMLTFAKLFQLSSKENQKNSPVEIKNIVNISGIELLMRNFGNENTVCKPYIYLPTLVSGLEENAAERGDNILFLLPGLEGCSETFRILCSKLQSTACVLQLGVDDGQDDLELIAYRLYKTVRERLSPRDSYKLLGYSFGSLLILKLAAKLEEDGYKGIVFCIDGSPEYLKDMANILFKSSDDIQLQNNIIKHSLKIVQSVMQTTEETMAKLSSIASFEDRIKCAIEMYPAEIKYSRKFLSKMVMVTYKRLKLVLNSNSNDFKKISSPIILMRQKYVPILKCNEKYGLDKYTTGFVTVHYLDDDHSTIVANVECTRIINNAILEFKLQQKPNDTVNEVVKIRQSGRN